MKSLLTIPEAVVTVQPVTEPITIYEAKKHLEIASDDSYHDIQIFMHMESARQQWERDTSLYYIQRTMRLTLPCLNEFRFTEKPVTAISAVTYYDDGNAQQTLASDQYQLDAATNSFRCAYDVDWPSTVYRWDAVQIDYTLGEHVDSTSVPSFAKSAMLLLVGYYFEQRGDADRVNDLRAYESLVRKNMRSTYP